MQVYLSEAGAVVTRRAAGADAPRLRAAGDRLARAAHPGVVEVVRSVGTAAEWELQLVHAGRPASLLAPLAASQVAALAVAVAATLADLHRGGVVHGHLEGSHVLVGPHGRPVLCGFGVDDGGAAPHDDVAAVGALIGELLGGGTEAELVPERRWGRRRSPDWARRSLLLLADHACAEPPSRRPTAARLAAAIASTIPDARLLDGAADDPAADDPAAVDPLDALRGSSVAAPERRARPRSLTSIGAAAVTLGAAVFGVGILRSPVSPTSTVSPPTTATVPASTPPTTVSTAIAPAVAVDGTVVTVGQRRFEVGQPGDRVAVGDWDCDGTATAAVLRPSTGEVFVFPSWTSGPDVVVSAAARIEGGVELVVGASADPDEGCGTLAVRRADGSVVPIGPAGAA